MRELLCLMKNTGLVKTIGLFLYVVSVVAASGPKIDPVQSRLVNSSQLLERIQSTFPRGDDTHRASIQTMHAHTDYDSTHVMSCCMQGLLIRLCSM